jgi:hypothetical protein
VPVPASFYWDALPVIFPTSLELFFGIGILLPLVRWARGRRNGARPLASSTESSDQTRRLIVLLLWGAAFLVYMLRIPHKEVRYLLPLAIPVVIVSALGLAALCQWLAGQAAPVKVAGLLLGLALVIVNYGTPFQKLRGPWYNPSLIEPWVVDRGAWETVQIALYLRRVSTPADTIYAAHNFPVLAFYSERRTISLLPIQENFNQDWPDLMRQPGFLVYFHPDKIKEIHSRKPLNPDRRFLESHPNFHVVRVFPTATVYRYLPRP